MKRTTVWAMTLVIWTSLMLPQPLCTAAAEAQLAPANRTPHTVAAHVPASVHQPASAEESAADTERTITSTAMADAVNQWIHNIAGEHGYSSWRQATWTSQPLGPGTHGWIIIVTSNGKTVGYMVIHAAEPDKPDSYRLTEYGHGDKPLFSLQTLHQALVQLELIHTSYQTERLYYAPLHTVWRVTSHGSEHYADAKTGEILPLDSFSSQSMPLHALDASTRLAPKHTIISSRQLSVFDPYERLPWASGEDVNYPSFGELQGELDARKRLTYAAAIFNGTITAPLAVTGYHKWSNQECFLLLEQNGQRAVPYEAAAILGKFYH
ncbi:hypothetical protein [Paenibacillus xerothermodurans]|uniref:Uncharacterized protein n=1 Tax=Paenibacillus xerothermodurans TaxID=1977292 RepID=A0A2W1NT19_PAEXE|nr:hypothetical protein [Paenibacillus xerothermodurans]PZE20916.1 hypothetical protein CBW46_009490 [Paenibacillus xerothermodurans]